MDESEGKKMRFKAYVRVRPVPGEQPNGVVQPEYRVMYLKDTAKGQTSECVFDRVFDSAAKQDAVFEEVGKPLVEHVLQGYNACAFAYGQTGAGKTYSMFGGDNDVRGLIPRACELLLRAAEQVNGKGGGAASLRVFVSFMDIYLEQVRDLAATAQGAAVSRGAIPGTAPLGGPSAGISPAAAAAAAAMAASGSAASSGSANGGSFSFASMPSMISRTKSTALGPGGSGGSFSADANAAPIAGNAPGGLEILEDASGMTFVKDLTFVEVNTVEEVLAVLRAGTTARTSGSGGDISSRSHAVFTISVVQYRDGQTPITGRLNLVDLAGSERLLSKPGGNEALRAKEARAINVSLTALGKVVLSLAQEGDRGHVSFRDTKLTRILKDSLAGNSYTSLLACLHPLHENTEECFATLQFAVRCSNISTAPVVNVLSAGLPGGDSGMVEELMLQVAQLKDELESTHTHYQKLLESTGGGGWGRDPGPVERAAGGAAFGSSLDGGVGSSGAGGAAGSISGSAAGTGTGMLGTSGGALGQGTMGGTSGSALGGGGMGSSMRPMTGAGGKPQSGGPSAARVSQLEANVRRLETALAGERAKLAQYEERLSAKSSEMDQMRERQMGKEHSQFAEIKRLRAQVAELTAALAADKVDAAAKLDETKRKGEEEAARLLHDVETLRNQLATVTGSVHQVVEKQSAAAAAERRQKERLKSEMDSMMREQAARTAEEHRTSVENLKQQSTFFLQKQATQLATVQTQLEQARATHAAQLTALHTELDYLASYAERVTDIVRKMESGVVPVHDRAGGIKAFRLPPRDQPPALDSARLQMLKLRNMELQERLTALSQATAAAKPSKADGLGVSYGLGGSTASSGSHGMTAGGMAVDLASLKAQWEAEMRAQIAAQVLADMKSEQTVEYIRSLEAQVARYRTEVQAEKKRGNDLGVALRSAQRMQSQPASPINRGIAAFTPAGTIQRTPSWGMGHTRPMTAGSNALTASGTLASSLKASQSLRPRPQTASAYGMITSSFRDKGVEVPQ